MTKKLICSFVVSLLFVALLCCPVQADETESVDYHDLFSRAAASDGAYADMCAFEIGSLFQQNPTELVVQLACEEQEVIDAVTSLLVYDQWHYNSEALQSFVTTELQSDDTSQEVIAVLNSIQASIDMYVHSGTSSGEPVTIPEPDAFHVKTIRGFIDAWIETGTPNAGNVFDVLANAYLADPELFSSIITDLNDTELSLLAEGLAYNITYHNKADALGENPSVFLVEYNDPLSTEIKNTIACFGDDDLLVNDDLVTSENEASLAADYPYIIPTISSMQYTFGTFEVGETVNLNVILSETENLSQVRQYDVIAYTLRNGRPVYLGERTVTLYPNMSSLSVNFSVTLTEAELLYTYVWINDPSTGATICGKKMDTAHEVWGKWSITVELTEDRSQLGTITLYSASGTEISSSVCLGQSQSNDPMNIIKGNTPIGVYTGELNGTRSNTTSYGQYQVIWIQGVSGYIVDECSHRSEFLIHGGREYVYEGLEPADPGFRLEPTNGCVRVMGEYQLQLENEITELTQNYHYRVGVVTITQDGMINLEDDA